MKNVLITILVITSLSSYSFAEDIFKWTAEDGVVHYSTKQADPKARLAELPKITHGDYKLGKATGITCDKHGGINCQAGADADGSVICYDGFDSAVARFTFMCGSPKLRLSDISGPDEIGHISVFVRNERSVPAKEPVVNFTNSEGATLKLKGPTQIEPYQMAEFTMISGALAKSKQKPDENQFSVTCTNCG